MTSISKSYDISENNPLNLFLAVVIVAFAAHVSGSLITNVFSNAPAEAAVVQLASVVFINRALVQLLAKMKFHPEVIAYGSGVFGPFMWATQASGLSNVTELFSRVTPF